MTGEAARAARLASARGWRSGAQPRSAVTAAQPHTTPPRAAPAAVPHPRTPAPAHEVTGVTARSTDSPPVGEGREDDGALRRKGASVGLLPVLFFLFIYQSDHREETSVGSVVSLPLVRCDGLN
jgi:hypothetical protein